jgi:hypothetical protein
MTAEFVRLSRGSFLRRISVTFGQLYQWQGESSASCMRLPRRIIKVAPGSFDTGRWVLSESEKDGLEHAQYGRKSPVLRRRIATPSLPSA